MQYWQGWLGFFWLDKWTNVPLSTKFPELYSFAHNDSISVASASFAESILDLFHTPLYIQAYDRFIELVEIIPDTHTAENDCWLFSSPKKKFSATQIYSSLIVITWLMFCLGTCGGLPAG